MRSTPRDVTALAGLLLLSGICHFVRPQPFESIVTEPLPYKRGLVYASGAAELACSWSLLRPRTRRLGGYATAVLMVAVLPANFQMSLDAVRSSRVPGWYKTGTVVRLPLQLPLVRTALKAARRAPLG